MPGFLFELLLLSLLFRKIYKIGKITKTSTLLAIAMGCLLILVQVIIVQQYLELGSETPYLFNSDPELYFLSARTLASEGLSSIRVLGQYIYFGDLGLRHVSYVFVLAASIKSGASFYGLHLLNLYFLISALSIFLSELGNIREKRIFTLLFLSTGSILSLSMILLKEPLLIWLIALLYRSIGKMKGLRTVPIYALIFLTRPASVIPFILLTNRFTKHRRLFRNTLSVSVVILVAFAFDNSGYWNRLGYGENAGGLIYAWSNLYSKFGAILQILFIPFTSFLSILGPLDVFQGQQIFYRYFQSTLNIVWLLVYIPITLSVLQKHIFSKRKKLNAPLNLFVLNLIIVSIIFGGTMHRYIVPFIPILYVGILKSKFLTKVNTSILLSSSVFIFIIAIYASR